VYALDHDHAEEEQESLEEPAQAEEATNAELTEASPCASHQLSLTFVNHYFMLSMLVH
jgi:hypothetical protein